MPAGAESSKPSMVLRPNCQLTQTTTTDTPSAATASPLRSPESAGNHWPTLTAANPKITTVELQMSVWKCRASASRAWLLYFLAVRARARDREASMAMETSITPNDHQVTSISAL